MTSSFLVGDFSTAKPDPDPRGSASASTRPDALPPGTRLDEYEIGPLLGESPLGLVYLAIDHALGRKVAIREFLPSALSGRGEGPVVALRSAGMAEAYRRGLRAFVDEARLLARFDDPSLVRVLRFWEAHFTAYIVMPYYEAPTLTVARERLQVPPAEPWIRGLLESLATSLELLHGESCLHRNVTPDRVLMLRDGRPMLLGPGAVRQVLGREAQITPIRSGFSAIEDYAESSDLPRGPWTDVYALGALARYCILGIPPVAAPVRSIRDPLIGMQDALYPLRVQWPDLVYSAGLMNAIDRALAVDPVRRPQSMAEFRALLHEAPPAPAAWTVATSSGTTAEAIFDPTRPEPSLNLLSATDLETDAFEASVSAMVDEALVDAPPMRGGTVARAMAQAAPEASVVRTAMADAHGPIPAQAADPSEPALAVDLPIDPDFAEHALGGAVGDAPFTPAGRPRWQRRLTAVAGVLLVGAFGYVGWTQYQRLQDEDHLASRVPATALSPAAAPASGAVEPDPIAEARLHPPAAGPSADPATVSAPAAEASAPAGGTPDRPSTSASSSTPAPVDAVAEAGSDADPSPSAAGAARAPSPEEPESRAPVRSARLARAAQREARAARLSAAPRDVCGNRADFALYRCMQTQCDKPQYVGHAQCRQFKLQDRVE